MNIKEAKMEVEKTVKVYLEKDENGEYRVPLVRQRPLFLVGAPGIGKTAIMEQVAEDLDLALVSYSMTHHTRQSAIGLPYLKEVEYGGKKFTKSEYTMSEIIASVYDVMEKTGRKEGILFLDEINCVSETLAPAMLQFLQYKVFGNQQVPERQERPRFIRKRQTENQEKEPERNKTDESRLERERAARQREVEQQRQRMKEEAQRNERLHDGKEQAMVHDMTEQVLGQTYKVPGTNISYDDASIMAKNNIRDSAELTGISLEDDGFANSVEEVQEMMKGYVFNGVPDIDEVYDMTKDKGPDVIAQAYVNVLKETDVKSNIHTLTKIDEKFCFEHQAFEKQFDYIREHDSAADRVLDKVEMEMGRDRADE